MKEATDIHVWGVLLHFPIHSVLVFRFVGTI